MVFVSCFTEASSAYLAEGQVSAFLSIGVLGLRPTGGDIFKIHSRIQVTVDV